MLFFGFFYVNIIQGGYYNMGFYDEAWFATHRGLSNVVSTLETSTMVMFL
jgi:hypothetical protein